MSSSNCCFLTCIQISQEAGQVVWYFHLLKNFPQIIVIHRVKATDVQAGFRKGRGTRDLIANTHWIIEKAREFQKNIYFCFIDYAKAFDCVDHNKLWKILQEIGISDHLTCLLEKPVCRSESNS